MNADRRLELRVVTGFLGSGKTTLLRRMLGERRVDVAVVVNESASAAVDSDLLAPHCARVVAVTGGCACCERLGETLDALRAILDEHERGPLAAVREVVIETSGLADPLPIVAAVTKDPMLRHHFRLGAVIAVVDGREGGEQLTRHPEVRRQVLAADEVVISKTDIVDATAVASLRSRLARLGALPASHAHTEVTTTSFEFQKPLDWVAFGVWLSLFVHAHGRKVLRIKGLVPAGGRGAVMVNAVHDVLFAPEHLPAAAVRARLVVIAEDLDSGAIRRSLFAFQGAA